MLNDSCLSLTAEERSRLEIVSGIVFDIQRYSLHDGPGLRTNVFFKGCPLRCGWCSNPESQRMQPELGVFAVNCIRCGQFAYPCPQGWTVQEGEAWKKAVLPEYTMREERCPAGGVRWFGRSMSAGEIMAEVRRDVPFYDHGGGMTLTGGEPTMQPDLAEALLLLAKTECITTAIETSGHTPWDVWERLLPYLDTILYDVKHIDALAHREGTGVDNMLILENLRRLLAAGAHIIVRIPLIPSFNAHRATVHAIGAFLHGLPHAPARIDLLPYHTLGRSKYTSLALPYPWNGQDKLDDAQVETWADDLRRLGFDVTIGG